MALKETKEISKMDQKQGVALSKETNANISDDAINLARKLVYDGQNRLKFNGLNFAERYRGFDLDLALHLRSNSDNSHIHALVQRLPLGYRNRECATSSDVIEMIVHTSGSTNRYQSSVFVSDVEIMDDPKEIVASSVWLQRRGCSFERKHSVS